MHAREFNETLCMDMAYYDLSENSQALVIHFVDEASRYHVAEVVKEGKLDKTHVLGNINQGTLINKYYQC